MGIICIYFSQSEPAITVLLLYFTPISMLHDTCDVQTGYDHSLVIKTCCSMHLLKPTLRLTSDVNLYFAIQMWKGGAVPVIVPLLSVEDLDIKVNNAIYWY